MSANSNTPMSKKEQRKLMKKGKKTTTLAVAEEVPTAVKETFEDIEVYECDVCLDHFNANKGIVGPCLEHFICNECAIDLFERSLLNIGEFPASCCHNGILPRRWVEHLLSQDFMDKYIHRLEVFYTPIPLRTFCSNQACGKFISSKRFENTQSCTIAHCNDSACATITCVGCKKKWVSDMHRCELEEDPRKTPDWLPEYSADCRIKRCPYCHIWVEHKEDCNHMECMYCSGAFCFICLQDYITPGHCCPLYGEPIEGYDDEGYERTIRGIHRISGLNREGYNASGELGISAIGVAPSPPDLDDGGDWVHGLPEHDDTSDEDGWIRSPFWDTDESGLSEEEFDFFPASEIDCMVAPILWAEQGGPPFRLQNREDRETAYDDFDAFGTQNLFQNAEKELKKQYWIISESNVGLPDRAGVFTFRLDTNPFIALRWDDEDLL